MANLKDVRKPRRKEVTVFLGDSGQERERIIKFDMNAFALLEEKYGTIQQAMESLQQGKIKDVRTILWAGLTHDEVVLDDDGEPTKYNITAYQVGGWIADPAQMQEVIVRLGNALSDDLPNEEHMTPEQPKPAAVPTNVTTYQTSEGTQQAAITAPVTNFPPAPENELAQVTMTEEERIQYEVEEAKNE